MADLHRPASSQAFIPFHQPGIQAQCLVRRVLADSGIIVWSHASASLVAEVLLSKSCQTLLLGDRIDVGTDDEGHDVEEGNPELIGEEFLGKSQADRGGDPGDAHDLPEADLDGCTDLMISSGTSDQGHGDEVDAVLDGSNLLGEARLISCCQGGSSRAEITYDQVADQNLHNLGFQACPSLEDFLQQPDEDVTYRRANQGTIGSHFRNARGEVVAMLIAILG